MSAPWQVLADCPRCRIEAAVLEWMDPAQPSCARGQPEWRRCRACGFEERAGAGGLEPFAAGDDLRDEALARAALARWATADGEADPDVFCRASFGASIDEVVGRLRAGEPVGSTFDVIAFLFPHAGAASGAGEGVPRIVDGRVPAPEPPRPSAHRPAADPRTPGRFLVSVMLADGVLRQGERKFVDAFVARNGLPALGPDDLRVWRPLELGNPPENPLRELLLESAVHLMHLDRTRDGSEWRVIRAFSSAWGVPESTLALWDERYGRRYSTAMQRLGDLLGRWL